MMDTGFAPDFVAHPVPASLHGHVLRITGYRETDGRHLLQREAAALVVPMVISFGSPFMISLHAHGRDAAQQSSFMAGLTPGPVWIASDGRAACVQVDFTSLGAYRLLGGAAPHLTGAMVPLDDLLGREGASIACRLADQTGWQARFDVVERFLVGRFRHVPSPVVAQAWHLLGKAPPDIRISDLARDIGIGAKHLSRLFRREIGVGPKLVTRIRRFEHARRMAARVTRPDWADIAAACGYADQPHLVREFRAIGGLPPTSLMSEAADGTPTGQARFLQD